MVRISATATFQDKDVKVVVKDTSEPSQVLSTFIGKLNKALSGMDSFSSKCTWMTDIIDRNQ